jgi:hypothetical protein
MSRSRDPRAPTNLTAEQLSAVGRHPKLVELRQSRDDLSAEIRSRYGKIKNAKGTELHDRYKQLSWALGNERKYLKTLALDETREQYFRTIDTQEVERQLTRPSTGLEIIPTHTDVVNHTFEERSRVADRLFIFTEKWTSHDVCELRASVIKDLAKLCSLREAPRQGRLLTSHKWDIEEIEDATKPDLFPLICPSTQCLFCLGDEHLSYAARAFSFSRIDALRRHMQTAHLKRLAMDDNIPCPHPACVAILQGIEHFKNHAAVVHNIFL